MYINFQRNHWKIYNASSGHLRYGPWNAINQLNKGIRIYWNWFDISDQDLHFNPFKTRDWYFLSFSFQRTIFSVFIEIERNKQLPMPSCVWSKLNHSNCTLVTTDVTSSNILWCLCYGNEIAVHLDLISASNQNNTTKISPVSFISIVLTGKARFSLTRCC